MREGIANKNAIDRNALRSDEYLSSLLEQALTRGYLQEEALARIQMESLQLLARQTERYQGGDSSIRVEQAQSLLQSLLFTIGVALKAQPSPEDALHALRHKSMEKLYQEGRTRVDVLLAETKRLHRALLAALLETEHRCYQETLRDGISGFFKLYNPEFSAQEVHITADYPLYNSMPRLLGIEFIHAYVTAAYCENLFCSYFAPDAIHHLLCGYAQDYQELCFNLYEVVLVTALGCVMAGVDCCELNLTEEGVQYLHQMLQGKTESERFAALARAMQELSLRKSFPERLTQYAQNSLPQVAKELAVAIKEDTLARIFFLPVFPEHQAQISVSYGIRMQDAAYRALLAEFDACRFIEDKCALIQREIHALGDFEDLLLDAQLCEADYAQVLALLRAPELAFLSKKYQEQFEREAFELREEEKRLHHMLCSYISVLPRAQQAALTQLQDIVREGSLNPVLPDVGLKAYGS